MVKPVAEFSAALFGAASTYCVTEYRVYMGGVLVDPHPEEGALLVATDGHRLVVVHDRAATCREPVIVEAQRGLVTLARKARDERISAWKNGKVALGDWSVNAGLLSGPFGDYRRLASHALSLVRAKTTGHARFNGKYLADLHAIGKRLAPGEKSVSVKLQAFGKNEGALTLWPEAPDAFGILMPMRDHTEDGLPGFMRPMLEQKRAAA